MRIGLDEAYEIHKQDEKRVKRITLFLLILLIITILIFMNQSVMFDGFFSPAETFRHFRQWFELAFDTLMRRPTAEIAREINRETYYLATFTQLGRVLIMAASGMLLALSGFIFQNVFRNPMAAPTMLGVSTGVNIAMLYLVITYGSMLYSMPLTKYKYCYLGAAIMLTCVMVLGKLSSGRNKFSVTDLLLVGVCLSQVVGVVQTAIINGLDEDVLNAYNDAVNVTLMNVDKASMICLGIAFAVSVIPMCMIRFSFNTVTYTPDETHSMGVNSELMRFITLICGTFMITAAMVHAGNVGMLSLVVPHIGRYLLGSDSRHQLWGNMFIGAIIMVVCKGIADLIPFPGGMPVGIIISLLTAPIFALFMGTRKRGWD